ncbi:MULTISPECIES: DUF3169 family protein [Anaerostipes]|uniref:DUF3169 family protein n=1 Tax=Anaerostipes butyraticus TaxID=645466 RepID=A0A916Q9M9_9FIRM|nr:MULTISPECIES: DUF3169 family protein [Anaerostipes]GFO84389.1 hypothetical protein ANBU17_07360 [Anaerostipes butyraticus]HJC82146.1 DUF3169 family protein [Candidatus Anaerostipes avicola]
MNERKGEIRRENRKALKKFTLVIVAAGIVGGFAGFFGTALSEQIKASSEIWTEITGNILFYLFPIVFLVLHIASFGIYSKYKKIKDMWDGEDEDSANQIEEKISYAIWAEYIATALGFLYFALMLGGEVFDSFGLWKGISVFLIFVINVVLVTIMQQKCVDLEKEMNPEKEGSVYDTKFSEKWLESCDEAEKMMIYRSAWASYRVMGTAYVVAWIVTFLANEFFDTGLFACCIVVLLWIIQTSVYCYKSIQISK